jgi:hypothetical protein
LAGDVVHILDAVDRLFKRRRNGSRDDFGRGAGINRRDLHGWWDDIRVLGHRQNRHRGEPEHDDKDADDRGESRMINEKVR